MGTHHFLIPAALCAFLASCGEAPPPADNASTMTKADSVKADTAAAPKPDPDAIKVTPDNFCRAETDMYLGRIVKESGLGKLQHERELVAIEKQAIVRINRDTYYSSAIIDLDAGPVTITMPETNGRFQSLLALDQDHYTVDVIHGAGKYTFTREKVGTRYMALLIRTFADPNDPADVGKAHALQDGITLEQKGGPGSWEAPKWDPISQKKVRMALEELAQTFNGFAHAFGSREEVDPIRHLVGTAAGWGGNPDREAMYTGAAPTKNDGNTVHTFHVPPVPVDGFWSVTVYNAKGYMEKNDQNAYSLNNITAKKNDDGSIDIQFGGCDGKVPNCLPITPGWNYTVRMYQPRKELLDGTWKFPEAVAQP